MKGFTVAMLAIFFLPFGVCDPWLDSGEVTEVADDSMWVRARRVRKSTGVTFSYFSRDKKDENTKGGSDKSNRR